MHRLKELIIELSYNCNLTCKMCGFWRKKNDERKFMSKKRFFSILKSLGPYSRTVRLNGRGESTIHPDFIEILDQTRGYLNDIDINLFTNLSFNDENILNAFVRNDVQLFISIDSPFQKELESIRRGCDYRAIMKNIENLSDIQPRPFIIFTIMEDNLNRIRQIGDFALNHEMSIIYNVVRSDQGLEYFVEKVTAEKEDIKNDFDHVRKGYRNTDLSCIIPSQISGVDLGERSYDQTHGQLETCPSLGNELCVLYNGDVIPCNMFNPYVFGNIFEQNFDDIMNGEKRKWFVNNHKEYYYCNNCACLEVKA